MEKQDRKSSSNYIDQVNYRILRKQNHQKVSEITHNIIECIENNDDIEKMYEMKNKKNLYKVILAYQYKMQQEIKEKKERKKMLTIKKLKNQNVQLKIIQRKERLRKEGIIKKLQNKKVSLEDAMKNTYKSLIKIQESNELQQFKDSNHNASLVISYCKEKKERINAIFPNERDSIREYLKPIKLQMNFKPVYKEKSEGQISDTKIDDCSYLTVTTQSSNTAITMSLSDRRLSTCHIKSNLKGFKNNSSRNLKSEV